MVVPVTAHAAFDKAAQLLQIRVRHVPVDKNQRADVGAMKRAINNETCLVQFCYKNKYSYQRSVSERLGCLI